MPKVGLAFPGQGSQYVGMGRDFHDNFPAVRELFAKASDILGLDIADLCFNGPQEALNLTENTQVCVLAVNIAIHTVFRDTVVVDPVVIAGHSLGEYSAIHASGAIGLSEVLKLVRSRAKYHKDAAPAGLGAMAAIVGLDARIVGEICLKLKQADEIVDAAIFNAPGQVVVSGHVAAVERIMAGAKDVGAASAVRLPISVPCHSPLLNRAAEQLACDLADVEFGDFKTPVIPNCDPDQIYTGDNVRDLLRRQIISPVRWQETVDKMFAMGADTIIELGPKRVLCGLIKRINRKINLLNVENMESLEKTLKYLASSG